MPGELSDSPCLIGIDAGTQSIRAIAFDRAGRKIAGAARPTPIARMGRGGEHDPDAIFAAVVEALTEIGSALAGRPVAGMAVASFGECCVLVDEAGKAVGPSIAWFDPRSEPAAEAIGAALGPARIFGITGAAVDPTFTLFKLAWMREHWPDRIRRTRCVLMMADWIAFRLSGKAATDHSLASRTSYFSIHDRQWSGELLALAGLGTDRLPPLRPSGAALGPVLPEILAETHIAGRPIVGVGGHDHVVGSFAVGFTAPGTILDSMGTAEALLVAPTVPLDDPRILKLGFSQGAIATNREMSFLHAGIDSSGGTVEWWRGIVGHAPLATLIAEAATVPVGSGGIAFLPHLAGSPPPRRDAAARGAFVGLTIAATRGSLYRAMLEGLAFQARVMLDGLASLADIPATQPVRIIGGSSRNPLLLQIKANAFGRRLVVVDEAEATALGAALLGGIAGGVYADLDAALAGLDRREHVVEPDADAPRYDLLRTTVFEQLQLALEPTNRALAAFARGG